MDPKQPTNKPPPIQAVYMPRQRLNMDLAAFLAAQMMADAHGGATAPVGDVEYRTRCTIQLYGWVDVDFGVGPRVCDLCTKRLSNSTNKETKRRLWEQRHQVRPIALKDNGEPEPMETTRKLQVGWRCREHWPDWLTWHSSDMADTKNIMHATEL